MSKYYCQNGASQTRIARRLEQFVDIEDALDLREEVAVLRSVTADRIDQYAAAHETKDSAAISLTGELAFEKAKDVINSVEKVGKHERARQQTMSTELLRHLVGQVITLAYDFFRNFDVPDEEITEFAAQAESIFTGEMVEKQISSEDMFEMLASSVPEYTEEPPQ